MDRITKYSNQIMGDFSFLTRSDSGEILYYENGVYRPGGGVVIEVEAYKRVKKL